MTDFLCGCISGVFQNIIGHPFDTFKTLQQNNKNPILKNPLRYYNGIKYPMLSQAILIGYNFQNIYFFNQYFHNFYISGFLGGITSSPIIFVFDYFKVMRQMNKPYKYNMNHILNLKGKYITLARECNAISLYYGTYDYLNKKMNYSVFLAGSLSGVLSWGLTYPLDVIKTRQITYNITFKEAIKTSNLFKGIEICLIRAFLVNSIAFYTFEESKNILNHSKNKQSK